MINKDITFIISLMRAEILINCYLYYETDKATLTDSEYDTFARTLCLLQERYPKEARKADCAKHFKKFTKECLTGVSLPFRHSQIVFWAEHRIKNNISKPESVWENDIVKGYMEEIKGDK